MVVLEDRIPRRCYVSAIIDHKLENVANHYSNFVALEAFEKWIIFAFQSVFPLGFSEIAK
jgi:hypothetical protein